MDSAPEVSKEINPADDKKACTTLSNHIPILTQPRMKIVLFLVAMTAPMVTPWQQGGIRNYVAPAPGLNT